MTWTAHIERTTGAIGTSTYSAVNNSTTIAADTTKGVYLLTLDPVANLAKGDRFLVQYLEKVRESGGTQRVIFSATIAQAQSENWMFPALPLGHGWDITIKKLAGTDRAFDLCVRKVGTWTKYAELAGTTVGSSELSLISGNTTLQTDTTKGIYWVLADGVGSMAKADDFEFRVMEAIKSGGTKRQLIEAQLQNAQMEIFVTPPLWLGNGFDATLRKTAGADCGFDTNIRKAA